MLFLVDAIQVGSLKSVLLKCRQKVWEAQTAEDC